MIYRHCIKLSNLKVKCVVGVRHQAVLIGTLQLEAMRDPGAGCAVLAITVEVGQAVNVHQLFEVLVGAVHTTCAQVLHHTCVSMKISMINNARMTTNL